MTAAHHRAFGALAAAGLALSMASGVVAQPVAPQPGGPTAMGDPGSSRLIGRVTDIVTGRPLAGVRVRAGEADGRTDNDGVYRLSLPPGAYRIRVTSPGYQGVTVVERELDPLIGDGEARVDVALPPLVAGADDARKVVDAIRGRTALTMTVPVTTTSVEDGEDVGTEDADPQRLAASLAVNEVPATIRVLMPEGQIVALDTDEYLKGVVPAEMGWIFRRAFEALKAQAIASRTYAAAHCMPTSAGDPAVCERGLDANVDTTTRTQVWRPVHYDITDAAVEATSGLAARLDGALFSTMYFARTVNRTLDSEASPCCGGRSVSFLRSVASPDPFDARHGHGAGLSQEGAAVLAEWGATAEEIITYYYTGATVAADPSAAAVARGVATDGGTDETTDETTDDAADGDDADADAAPPETRAGTARLDADRFGDVAPGSVTAVDALAIRSLTADADTAADADDPAELEIVDSPTVRADFPFMALAVRWTDNPTAGEAVTATAAVTAATATPSTGDAYPPDGAADASDEHRGDVLVRVSDDGETWSDWLPMLPDEDGRTRSTDNWTRLVVARGRYAQLRIVFSGPADARAFDQLDLHYFNADAGPRAPIVPASEALNDVSASSDRELTAASIEDTVIKRAGWGADEQLRFQGGAEIWPPEYTIPKALIIHHTVTQNDPVDPATIMRAIYYYHAVTRGWGDIGYNFLIDHRGNVYEGRFGGERNGRITQGGHALQFNTNSIGVALLGTFTDVRPPAAAESALVSFCAAKAFRYRVDPQAGVTLLGTRFAHGLMGHRDALPGHTACPGNAAYPRMDAIRIGVAALLSELGGQPTVPATATRTPPPTVRPTATPTRRPTATRSTTASATPPPASTGVPTPPAGCIDGIANGGFEAEGDAWVFNRSARTRWDVLAGVQAAFVGLRNDDPDNGTTYASIVQTIQLPARIDRATLRFAFRSTGDDADRRLVRLMDGQGRVVALGDVSLPATTPGWTVRSFDVGAALAPLVGQPLRIYFGVVNNGDGRRSYVRFDEVRLELCPGPGGQTVDPTAAASATAAATRTAAPSATPSVATPSVATPSVAPPRPTATRTAGSGPTPTRPGTAVMCAAWFADGGFEPLTASVAEAAPAAVGATAALSATSAVSATTVITASAATTATTAVSATASGDGVFGRWRPGGDLPVSVQRGTAHGGVAAARLGPEPGGADRFGYASLAQTATLPLGITSADLRLWVRPDPLASGDTLSIEIRRPHDGVRQVLALPIGGLPAGRWTELHHAVDAASLGTAVEVYISLLNRRQSEAPAASAVWVDDIGFDICHRPSPTIAVPFLAVERP